MKPSLVSLKNRFAPQSRWGAVGLAPRRTNRGGVSWSSAEEAGQPQDGASSSGETVAVLPSAMLRGQFASAYAKLNEPDDARITGATRSLGRRLLGLNIPVAKPAAAVRQGLLPQRAGMLAGQTQVA